MYIKYSILVNEGVHWCHAPSAGKWQNTGASKGKLQKGEQNKLLSA